MEQPRTIRDGELTTQALADALAAEQAAGRRPTQLAVGSRLLEVRALQVLAPADGSFDELRSAVPNVLVDVTLPDDSWELRES